MKLICTSAVISLLSFNLTIAQTVPSWHLTPAPIDIARYDDITFINDKIGWAVGFDGVLIKTVDQGNTWGVLNGPIGDNYRAICFLDSLTGYIGKLEPSNNNPLDTNFLFKSINGGDSWSAITNLPGPQPAGICGMFHLGDSILYAVGRYFGPAGFYKTTDKGLTWDYTDMSSYVTGLVDCYFWSPDSGIVAGCRGTPDPWDSGGVILSTFDGGISWQERYANIAEPAICWKISFPSRQIGYVSLQSFDAISTEFFLKTIDGGLTWNKNIYTNAGYNAEGIGFVNDSVGWIGGGFNYSFETTDGGSSWVKDTFGFVESPYTSPGEGALNRFRFISDTLGFASGTAIYRYSKEGFVSSVADNAIHFSNQLFVHPNPASNILSVDVNMENAGYASLTIQNLLGELSVLVDKSYVHEGVKTWEIDVTSLHSGIYNLALGTEDFLGSTRIVIFH